MPFQKQKLDINVFHPGGPHPKQWEILQDDARFKLVRCGRKFGKTQLLVSWLMKRAISNECPAWGSKCKSKHDFAYIAPFRTQAESIIWRDHIDKILTHCKEAGLPFKKNETKLTIEFPSGGMFKLMGVDNPDSLRGISNLGAVVCDEYDDYESDIWPLVIRPNLVSHSACGIIAGTPKGKAGMYRMERTENAEGERIWKSYHFTSHENSALPDGELEDLISEYKGLGEDYYNQEILALYVKPIGVVYKDFDDKTQHVPAKYDPTLPLHLSFDFGVNDPTAILWIQPTGEGKINIIDYHEESNADVEYFVSLIKGRGYHRPSLCVGDPAGNARQQGRNISVIDEYKRHGFNIVTLSYQPHVKDRVRRANQMLPRIRVNSSDPSCDRFIDVLTNYRYPQKKENLTNQENEKPIHNEFSHGASAFEFYASTAPEVEMDFEEQEFPEFTAIRKDGFYV